ncbi:hypothetical protein, partial [Intrasporangium chromatireducens]|uniref:hypothetical protein n=1 Tax=Intrasporangium chromatireducens TaxID=1386088 RepID=UPI000558A2A4
MAAGVPGPETRPGGRPSLAGVGGVAPCWAFAARPAVSPGPGAVGAALVVAEGETEDVVPGVVTGVLVALPLPGVRVVAGFFEPTRPACCGTAGLGALADPLARTCVG